MLFINIAISLFLTAATILLTLLTMYGSTQHGFVFTSDNKRLKQVYSAFWLLLFFGWGCSIFLFSLKS